MGLVATDAQIAVQPLSALRSEAMNNIRGRS